MASFIFLDQNCSIIGKVHVQTEIPLSQLSVGMYLFTCPGWVLHVGLFYS